MPKLWTDTIEGHRREVEHAILDATAALVAEHGPSAVTMSQIADTARIGRATLYKYFPDVEAILDAWHARHVARHLERLTEVRDQYAKPAERLEAVLETYALISYERSRGHDAAEHHANPRGEHARRHQAPGEHAHGPHATEIATLVHRSEHVADAERRLTDFLRDLIRDAAKAGSVRKDVSADELAAYCLHALDAASTLRSKAALPRLVAVTLSALRPGR
ncbi:MAG TPA: TetR/AcrR family transcriptional regulator [Candidatus Limnocylindria bacterium]|nr:TetR/AcrR family transcriptional regulator [Candidatus Limnocylindria bacterium]